MSADFQRRGALAVLGVSVVASLMGASPAGAASLDAPPVPFDVWFRINRVLQSYADCIDRVDLDGLMKVFTADGVFEFGPGVTVQGRSGIRDLFVPILAKYTGTFTFLSTPNVAPGATPGTYTSWTYFMATHNWKDGHRHSVFGRYGDEFQLDKETGGLLIARRKLVSQLTENDVAARFTLERNG